MIRLLFVLVVVGVIFTLYSLVDAAMSDPKRARGVNKSVWVVVIAVLPIIGGILWFTVGRGQVPTSIPVAPDDDPAFTGAPRDEDLDRRIRDIERELADLDSEVYPVDGAAGTTPGTSSEGTPHGGDTHDSNPHDSSTHGESGTDPESGRPGGPRASND